jgi:hypothetical protein
MLGCHTPVAIAGRRMYEATLLRTDTDCPRYELGAAEEDDEDDIAAGNGVTGTIRWARLWRSGCGSSEERRKVGRHVVANLQ